MTIVGLTGTPLPLLQDQDYSFAEAEIRLQPLIQAAQTDIGGDAEIASVHTLGSLVAFKEHGQALAVAREAAFLQNQGDLVLWEMACQEEGRLYTSEFEGSAARPIPPTSLVRESREGFIPELYFRGGRGTPGFFGYWHAQVVVRDFIHPKGLLYVMHTAVMSTYNFEINFFGEQQAERQWRKKGEIVPREPSYGADIDPLVRSGEIWLDSETGRFIRSRDSVVLCADAREPLEDPATGSRIFYDGIGKEYVRELDNAALCGRTLKPRFENF